MNTQHIKLALGIATGIVAGILAKDTAMENMDKLEAKFTKKKPEEQK